MHNYSVFQVNIFSNNRDIRQHLENSKSKKGHNFVKIGELPPLLVWAPLLIVNNYSEFQVNPFSSNRDIRKYQSFARRRRRRRHPADDARAMTIPRSFPLKQPIKRQHKNTIIDITSDSQANSNFPYRWSPASLTFNIYAC